MNRFILVLVFAILACSCAKANLDEKLSNTTSNHLLSLVFLNQKDVVPPANPPKGDVHIKLAMDCKIFIDGKEVTLEELIKEEEAGKIEITGIMTTSDGLTHKLEATTIKKDK